MNEEEIKHQRAKKRVEALRGFLERLWRKRKKN